MGCQQSGPSEGDHAEFVPVPEAKSPSPVNMLEAPASPKAYAQAHIVLDADAWKLSTSGDTAETFKQKCKVICTMGPACWDPEMLEKIIAAGMNIARLNFSHGEHEMHRQTVAKIRAASKKIPGRSIAIMLDTKGPEIRTGLFREGVGESIELKQGQELKLVTDYAFKGDSACLALSYQKLPTSVKPGNIILVADGSLSLKVKECGRDFVITEVLNDCKLGERKNCNLPGVKVDLPILQEKDINDLLQFAIPEGVDFIAASFVQTADDVKAIRETLGVRGRHIKIISKIENEEGLKNFDAIAAASDAIMVARGDLGMEIPPEKVFLAQKMMIAHCNLMGTPVITATQMLESMTKLPRPTRAEASDVANAVLDGTDCVMLSGETAAGAFPLEAVRMMRRICGEAEGVTDYDALYLSMRARTMQHCATVSGVESVCSSAVKATLDSACPLILALTETGHTARVIAKYRPRAPILAVTVSDTTARQLCCVRGVVPLQTDSFQGTDSVIKKALLYAKSEGMVKMGDCVVAVHGQQEESAGHSNLLKMVVVP